MPLGQLHLFVQGIRDLRVDSRLRGNDKGVSAGMRGEWGVHGRPQLETPWFWTIKMLLLEGGVEPPFNIQLNYLS